MTDDNDFDEFEDYELRFEQTQRARKTGKRSHQRAAPADGQQVAELAEASGLEAGFVTTYQPARFEAVWLLDSLRPFYEQHLINDVLASVKGGKEASVYRCAAEAVTGETLLAAKVYRPRQFRNLRNDKMYRDGRTILTADGRPVKNSDHRIMRAVGKKTAFGVQVAHTSWLMHEFTTLEQLYNAGAAVPKPFAVAENALLMAYGGDANTAAPTLNGVRLERREAEILFHEVLRNIELMLQHGLIHGDLSAYNILYWQGRIMLIDFPQVTHVQSNRHAEEILRRDITRVCEYFVQQGVRSNSNQITNTLWQRYAALDPDDEAADSSALEF